jgi:hypothetical protein
VVPAFKRKYDIRVEYPPRSGKKLDWWETYCPHGVAVDIHGQIWTSDKFPSYSSLQDPTKYLFWLHSTVKEKIRVFDKNGAFLTAFDGAGHFMVFRPNDGNLIVLSENTINIYKPQRTQAKEGTVPSHPVSFRKQTNNEPFDNSCPQTKGSFFVCSLPTFPLLFSQSYPYLGETVPGYLVRLVRLFFFSSSDHHVPCNVCFSH